MADVLLGLGAVVSDILLHQAGSVRGVLAGEILQLVGLGADDGLGIANLLVNDLAVADVDKRSEVGDIESNQSQSPERNETDEPVPSEGRNKSL